MMPLRNGRALIVLVLLTLWAGCQTGPPPDERPNLLFILMDDVRWDDLGYTGHPFVQTPHIDRIAREGVQFRNSFAATPLCSPNRASILTGQYAHAHGIIDNVDRSAQSHQLITFPKLLQDSGYETAFIGKWHMGVDDTRRPGFDHWLSIKGQGRYVDPEVNDNGETKTLPGYATDVFSERAVEFISQQHEKPFLLYLSHKAVHPNIFQYADGSISPIPADGGFLPAERHKDLYAGEEVPRRPNTKSYAEGKPALQRKIEGLPDLGPDTGTPDHIILNRLRMVTAADEGIGRILETLESSGTARQHRDRLHRRSRLFLRRARAEQRAAPGVRRNRPYAAGGSLPEVDRGRARGGRLRAEHRPGANSLGVRRRRDPLAYPGAFARTISQG